MLFTTPQRFGEIKDELRRHTACRMLVEGMFRLALGSDDSSTIPPLTHRLVLAVRRAVGVIHRDPRRAARHYTAHIKQSASSARGDNKTRGGVLGMIAAAARSLDPRTMRARRIASMTDAATMAATLPAFPNDNAISSEYFDALMSWLVRTGQACGYRVTRTCNSGTMIKAVGRVKVCGLYLQ